MNLTKVCFKQVILHTNKDNCALKDVILSPLLCLARIVRDLKTDTILDIQKKPSILAINSNTCLHNNKRAPVCAFLVYFFNNIYS